MQEDKPPADLDVKVLTSGHWPSHPAVDLALPEEMAACVRTFQEYFSSTTNHKKLLWVHTQVRSVCVRTHNQGFCLVWKTFYWGVGCALDVRNVGPGSVLFQRTSSPDCAQVLLTSRVKHNAFADVERATCRAQ